MGAVLEDEACHEDISIGIEKGNPLITNTRVPYKVYNSVPLVLYLKLLVTTVTEVSPSRFVVCRRSGDRRAAI
jgi:hypothetical protein